MSGLPPEASALIKRTTLIVRDMAASRRWYEQVLGMQVWMDTEFVLSGEGLAAGAAGIAPIWSSCAASTTRSA